MKKWFITGINSGFGRALTEILLAQGDFVIGTVRHPEKITDLTEKYPTSLEVYTLDMREIDAIKHTVAQVLQIHDYIDVLVNNAGYGLFGAAEELTSYEINDIIATNLTGPIELTRAFIPSMRQRKAGRIIQISSYGGQVAFPGNSLYHATKWGLEGFSESLASELADFNVSVTIIEPGGARTEFRYGSAQVAELMPEYDGTSTHAFLNMLNPDNGLAAGDPEKMAQRIIESTLMTPAPLRLMLGSQALSDTLAVLEQRINAFKAQADIAASTDVN